MLQNISWDIVFTPTKMIAFISDFSRQFVPFRVSSRQFVPVRAKPVHPSALKMACWRSGEICPRGILSPTSFRRRCSVRRLMFISRASSVLVFGSTVVWFISLKQKNEAIRTSDNPFMLAKNSVCLLLSEHIVFFLPNIPSFEGKILHVRQKRTTFTAHQSLYQEE